MNMNVSLVTVTMLNINVHAYWDCTSEISGFIFLYSFDLLESSRHMPTWTKHLFSFWESVKDISFRLCTYKELRRSPSTLYVLVLICRHSGMDWQGTLCLIRQMAWGETLIWTSSASKRTAPPGWVQRPETANYTTLLQRPGWPIHVC